MAYLKVKELPVKPDVLHLLYSTFDRGNIDCAQNVNAFFNQHARLQDNNKPVRLHVTRPTLITCPSPTHKRTHWRIPSLRNRLGRWREKQKVN